MNLREHYEELYTFSIQRIEDNDYHLDSLIDSATDNRFGVSLIIRPSELIKKNIQDFLKRLKLIEPLQYYYPNSDLHVTLLSIISCYNGFKLNEDKLPLYLELIKNSLQHIHPFEICFKGVTTSPSGVLLQGFPTNEELERMRDSIRARFKASTLKHSIDQRYVLKTAHATLLRFRQELLNKEDFLDLIKEYRESDFGSFEIEEVELVFNDWYHRKKNTRILGTFR